MDIETILRTAVRSGVKPNPMAALKRLSAGDRQDVSLSIRIAMEELGITYQEALHTIMEIGIAMVKEDEYGQNY